MQNVILSIHIQIGREEIGVTLGSQKLFHRWYAVRRAGAVKEP